MQTTRVVCTNYGWSLYRLRRGFDFRKCKLCFCLANQVISIYGMSLWFRAYGIPFSALTANLTIIPKGVTLRVSLNFNALVGRATASKFRCIMSAVGTTLLQSPGFHFGLCPHCTLGIHERKVISSSVGAALTARTFISTSRSAAPLGLNKCIN